MFHATRPKFFPASILPVLAGTAWGVASGGSSDAAVFLLALLATACVHAGVNVLNDVGDDAGGTDRINQERIYPYTGGSGFIQEGNLSAAAMARLGITLLVVAAISGLVLLLAKGAVVLWFGVAGVALALMYFAAVVTTWLCVAGRLPLLAPLVPVGLPVLAARAAAAIRRGPCRSSMTHGIEATLAIPTIGAVGLTGSAQYLALFSRG